jgi:iron complex outermembrane receptor protein
MTRVSGRGTRTLANGSNVQGQAFRATVQRDETTLWNEEMVYDIDARYHSRVEARHDLVLSAGYRDDDFASRPTFTLYIPWGGRILNTFFQDQIAVARRLTLTAGSKLEHNNLAGWGVLPSARVMTT